MVKIPRNESRQQVTSQGGIAPKSPDVASIGARVTQQLGGAVEEVANKFKDLAILNETTKADTEARRNLKEIEIEAANDPNPNNLQTYQDKISKAISKASNNITLPIARDRFNAQFASTAIASDFNVRKTLRANQIDQAETTALENLDTMKRDFIDSGSLLEKEVLSKGRDALINANVNLGVWDKKAAFDLKKSLAKDWQDTDIRSAIATDATIAKDMLLNGDFKDLSADETAKWVETADKKIKRSKKIAQEKIEKLWVETTGNVMGELEDTSVEDLIQLVVNNQINPSVADDIIKWKRDPEAVQYETDKEIWMEIYEESLNPEQDLRKFQKSISKGLANKNIQANDALNLSVEVKELFKSAIKFKSQENPILRAKRSAVNYIKGWANNIDKAYSLTKDLLSLTKGAKGTPENIETTARQLVKDKIKEENPNKTKYVADQTYTFQSGTYKCIGQNEKGKPIFEEA